MDWPLLADVPTGDVHQVLLIARRRTFARGEVVFHHGDPGDCLHLIVSGRFAVRVRTPVGDTALITVHGPGDAFGELALVSHGATRSATVSALEAAETRSVYRDDFFALQRRYPAVNAVLAELLAGQVRRLNQRLLEAHYVDADTRVRRRLGDLASMYGHGDDAEIRLTQEDLAQMAGTSRATVNRVLNDEERRGTIELRRGRTIVLDADALARRAR